MGDYWEITAQLFTSLFERPKMTEKLLTKPPFKYLFDIVNETRKATGFGEGLYANDELDPGYYEDKNRKMFFLKKIIALTSIMLDAEIEAKPNKIVAGVEPEKTNTFLQEMYRAAAASGQDSTPFVQKTLASLAAEESELYGRPPPNLQASKPAEKPKEEKKTKPKDPPPQEEPPKQKEKAKPQLVEEPKPEIKPEPTGQKLQRPPSAQKGGKKSDDKKPQQEDDDWIEKKP